MLTKSKAFFIQPRPAPAGMITDRDAYVHRAYESAIDYSRKSAKATKRSYKIFRFLAVCLGSLVTLLSSLAATKYVDQWPDRTKTIIVLSTPVIAAILSIITGLSQSFQCGSTWREMSLHAEKVAAERDRFLATNPANRNYVQELETLHGLLIHETESFFQRILDTQLPATPPTAQNEPKETVSAAAGGAG